MTLTSILITSIYQRLGCQHAKVNKTNQLSLCKRGPEYVERRIISSFTMICKSEKKSLCYLGSRNHPQRTSANFFLFFDTPSPLTHFCTYVTTLYRHSPRRQLVCMITISVRMYKYWLNLDCSAIHFAIMNRKSMMKQNQDFCIHTYYVNSEFPKIYACEVLNSIKHSHTLFK